MNCKPGDLAIIVRAISTPNLLGHIVEVVGPYLHPVWRRHPSDNDFAWEIRYPDGRLIESMRRFSGRCFEPSRAFGDSNLRPIRPGDLHETTDERKEVTA